jgi:hypothetical protein
MDAALKDLASEDYPSDKQSTLSIQDTMNRSPSEYSIDEFAELLVDIDGMFQDFTDPMQIRMSARCQTFSDRGLQLRDEVILEDETATASHVYISSAGKLVFRFKTVPPDGSMGYDSFDVIALEDMFPDVAEAIGFYLKQNHSTDLRKLWGAVHRRHVGKPQMIDLANERITYGRKMRACNLLEEEANAKDASYEADESFGLF